MAEDRFSGVLAPVVTPFNERLEVDLERFVAHARWLLSNDVALAVFGTNSEANSMSVDEKTDLLDALIERGIEPLQLMPGTGCCALPDSVRLTAHAVNLGCRGTLMLPPFYYKGVSDDGLFAYYSEVIQRVASDALRIYLYHIPPVSQVSLSVDLIDRLVANYPDTIAGIKDSSGDWDNTQAYLKAGWDDFRVFVGSETFLLNNMRLGGAGCISATANVNPAPISSLAAAWRADDAHSRQRTIDSVRELFQAFPMIAALKATLGFYREDSAWERVRPPLVALDDEARDRLRRALEKLPFTMPGLAEFY